jgi:16S rRNA (adenine1518-N6/adenine1519-N6)-dimethyltransferase
MTIARTRKRTLAPATVPEEALVPERPEEIRAVLRSLGVVPSRNWGQSFLRDPFVADAEAALVGPGPPGAPVVEIGGGLGVLTAALLRRGLSPLTVVERDRRLANFLAQKFAGRAHVLSADALDIPVETRARYVGNLPYSAATPILLRLMAARVPRIVFLVQREVAERMAAGPGTKVYGRLSIFSQLHGSVELFRTVPAEAFVPQPEVESRLAVFESRSGPLPVPSVPEFERMVQLLFSSRRKQLGNLLPRLAGHAGANRLAERSGWPDGWARLRPEDLAPDAYFALARARADA